MKRTYAKLTGLIILAAAAAPVHGDLTDGEFVNPPENGPNEWFNAFPYQRNIVWDFSVDPRTPGNDAQYFGTLDGQLNLGDAVDYIGDVGWSANFAPGYNGVVGIDNRSPFSNLPKVGKLSFRIANLVDDAPIKHIYYEMEFFLFGAGTTLARGIDVPRNHEITGNESTFQSLGGAPPLNRRTQWIKIEPNPPFETLNFNFVVPVGGFAVIDMLHVATESKAVPAPGTVVLIAIGTALFRRRRRRI